MEVKKEAWSHIEVLGHLSYSQHPVILFPLGKAVHKQFQVMVHKGVSDSSSEPSEWHVPSALMTWSSRKIRSICVILNKIQLHCLENGKIPRKLNAKLWVLADISVDNHSV